MSKTEAKRKAPPEDPVAQVFAMLDQLAPLKSAAIDRLLEDRQKIDDRLKQLGWSPASVAKGPGVKGSATANRVCKVCGQHGHDGRFHRFDKKAKPGSLSP